MLFDNRTQGEAYRKIDKWLPMIVGEDSIGRLDDPDEAFWVSAGSADARVGVLPWDGNNAVVRCRATLAVGARVGPALFRYLMGKNAEMRLGAFGVDGDGEVVFEHSIVGANLTYEQFKASILAVMSAADEYDEEIIDKFGGQTFVEAFYAPGSDDEDAEYEYEEDEAEDQETEDQEPSEEDSPSRPDDRSTAASRFSRLMEVIEADTESEGSALGTTVRFLAERFKRDVKEILAVLAKLGRTGMTADSVIDIETEKRVIFQLLHEDEETRRSRPAESKPEPEAKPVVTVRRKEQAVNKKSPTPGPLAPLADLAARIGEMRRHLSRRIVGQEQAIEQVCDAVFAAEAYRSDKDRGPRAVLTFVGPPGVGKTFTAEETARWLFPEGAFLRLDMSAYAEPQAYGQLIGSERVYVNAQPGLLTGFVKEHPRCVVLVDEIEKAHRTTRNLFLQVLDAGRLEDKFTRETIDFSGAILVFTTNLGRALYDLPNRTGFLSRAKLSRSAILDALAAEAQTGEGQGFPPEFISRLGKGHAVLFRRFEAHDLEKLAGQALDIVSERLKEKFGIGLEIGDPRIPALMVLRCGPDADARQLKTTVENLLLDRFLDLLLENREVFSTGAVPTGSPLVLKLSIGDDSWKGVAGADGGTLRVLVVDDDAATVEQCRRILGDASEERSIEFEGAEALEETLERLRKGHADAVLLDLHIGESAESPRFESGVRILEAVRANYPGVPVFLFSEFPERRSIEPDVLEKIVRAGGGRDFFRKGFAGEIAGAPDAAAFFTGLVRAFAGLRIERALRRLLRTRKAVEFDLAGDVSGFEKGSIVLAVRNIRVVPAVSALDAANPLGSAEVPRERFSDVVGHAEVKKRLSEVVAWLADPAALRKMGVDLPRGILLAGPPGTGKTLLARALAGEAEMPFFAVSGSEFFNKWLGETERLIRDLFSRARRYAPSVIFIDEIDAIGTTRGGSDFSQYKDAALNQLLASMDGFSGGDAPVFVVAATNRDEILDPALTRPGRFDHVIRVEEPDRAARLDLLRLRTREIPLDPSVNLEEIADGTMGLSGASLVQIVKEAAILAIRDKSPAVTKAHFREAENTVRYGLAEKEKSVSPAERRAIAVHEAGHAVASFRLRPEVPIVQVSIVPRNRAGGIFEKAGREGRDGWTRDEVLREIRVDLAGRAAEEAILGPDNVTSGCEDDLESAAAIARQAVTKWGMGGAGGLFEEGESPVFGAATATAWLREAYRDVKALIEREKATVEALAKKLLQEETILGEDLAAWLARRDGG